MDLTPKTEELTSCEENVKSSWSADDKNQCQSESQTVTSGCGDKQSKAREMIVKNYQNTMLESTDLQVCKLEENVFPLSPSTVGSRSPPPYPGYGDGFQQDGYFENRFNTNNVNSASSSVGNIYNNSSNQISVSYFPSLFTSLYLL